MTAGSAGADAPADPAVASGIAPAHPARLALPAGGMAVGAAAAASAAPLRAESAGRSRRGRGLRRGSGGGRGGRLVAARLRPLVDVTHSAFEQLAHVRVGLGAFFDLVGHHRLGHVSAESGSRAKSRPLRTRSYDESSRSDTARCTGRSTCTWRYRYRTARWSSHASARFSRTTITMQSIGQARSQARHPVQISRSTSRIPR